MKSYLTSSVSKDIIKDILRYTTMKTTKKLIAFPDTLITLVSNKAKKYGFSFGEYVRYVLANDIRSMVEQPLDSNAQRDFEEGMIDAQLGNTVLVQKEEIKDFISNISKQDGV